MNKRMVAISVLILAALLVPTITAQASNGVDDLRGRWDIQWQMESEGPGWLPELTVNVTDLEISENDPNVYLATGCMAVAEFDYFAPLSLQATDNLDGTYDVVFLSTVVPGVNGSGPFIARFEGLLEVFGNGVTDDVIGGNLQTGYGGGAWTGEHHDRRRVKCPAADPSVLYFDPDVYMERDRSPNAESDYTLFGGSTNVVSSAMQIELPDGRIVVAGFEQDIFTAHIDFISEFAFGSTLNETPVIGQPYSITLLDNLGNPIPGTETVDYWFSCPQGAPSNPQANYVFEEHVNLSWTGVADVLGQFEPNSDPQIGFYQIEVNPFEEGEMLYGMNLGSSTFHIIPWDPFVVDQVEDDPDGFDHGISFSELDDGLYSFRILSFSESHRDAPGFGLECQSVITADNLLMEKAGSDLNFFQLGYISGTVYDDQGVPLAGIAVDTDEGGYGTCTDENGFYSLEGIPYGTYNVVAGRDFCEPHSYAEQTIQAVEVGSEGVNFYLEPHVEPFQGFLNVHPEFGFAETGGWEVGIPLSLSYGSYQFTETTTAADWDPEVGQAFFENLTDLGVGTVVSITDGINTKVLEIAAVSFDYADESTDTVGGTAPAGSSLYVGLVDENGAFFDAFDFQADENGNWSAVLGDFGTVADAWVQTFDEDGDSTVAHLYIELPPEPSSVFLNVEPDHGWAESGGWAPGSTITLTFDSYSAVETDADNDGFVFFDLSGTGIAPGAEVTVTDGVEAKVLVVSEASFDAVNDVENTARGTGPANAGIHVAIWDVNGNNFDYDGVQIDASGAWLVDFDNIGADFAEVTNALVQVFDEDGDSTISHLDLSAP